MSVLRVAVPSPLRRLFDYLPPAATTPETAAALQPGVRLKVPFGNREVTAILIAVADHSELGRDALKPALEILDTMPLVTPSILDLCRWAVDYYHHPPGEIYPVALPVNLRKGRAPLISGEPGWRLSNHGLGLAEGALARSPKQSEAVRILQQSGQTTASALLESGISRAILKTLADKGLVEPCSIECTPQPPQARDGLQLNDDQAGAVQAIVDNPGTFSCHLLEGVTGSGKTEVYLQAIARCLEQGRQALVLIPEIGLTPQTLSRFHQRFDARIEVLHSGLGDRERELTWHAAREGLAHIVIGTRSAVFTPLANPGLIVVDEEHDGSYKQQDGFRYSARDLAVKRAQLEHCTVVLGSATPSLESLQNATSGRYRHHHLTRRAGDAAMPDINAIDVRGQALQGGLSDSLRASVASALDAGSQVLLFLNRRGYATALQCHDCGWVADCRACDARLTVHRRQRRLRCHHCGASETLPTQCPGCRSARLLTNGLGTEQAEDALRREFTRWPIHRVDSDSMQGRGAMAALAEAVGTGEPCILVGTQMLSKGHHFPGVQLVGVLDADALLFSADFRGEERMAQLLTQVAGRAGREQRRGSVLLQTHHPDHPALQAMLTQTYGQRARAMLEERRQSGLPPAGHLVLIRCDSADASAAEGFLQQLRRRCADASRAITVIGPLPSALPRRAGKFRFQLTLLAASRGAVHRATAHMVAAAGQLKARGDLRWSVDVDPSEVM